MYQHSKKLLIITPLIAVLVSCSSGNDNRYRNTELLERPPVLAITKKVNDVECCEDTSSVPKNKAKAGLGDDVKLISSKPMQIKLNQPIKTAWNSIGLALKQSGIKVTDQERDKGFYYVAYKPASLLSGLFNKLSKESIYLLTLSEEDNKTIVLAKQGNATEQNSALTHFASDDEEARSDAEDLLQQLYDTLHDDLKDE